MGQPHVTHLGVRCNRCQLRYLDDAEVTASVVEIPKGTSSTPHMHEREGIVVVLKGAWRFVVSGRETLIRAGNVFVIPSNTSHCSEALEDTLAICICNSLRTDFTGEEDKSSSYDPDQFLWAV
jgi:quercetin dioxygenase-like cupin family protein